MGEGERAKAGTRAQHARPTTLDPLTRQMTQRPTDEASQGNLTARLILEDRLSRPLKCLCCSGRTRQRAPIQPSCRTLPQPSPIRPPPGRRRNPPSSVFPRDRHLLPDALPRAPPHCSEDTPDASRSINKGLRTNLGRHNKLAPITPSCEAPVEPGEGRATTRRERRRRKTRPLRRPCHAMPRTG